MKICLLASELAPFAKTGGLGDAVAGLAGFLHDERVDLRLFLPHYSSAKVEGWVPVEFLQGIHTEVAGRQVEWSVHTAPLPGSSLPVYLIHCPALYDRAGIYDDRGDEHLRFSFFVRAVIESCQRMGFGPDVFHVHDWHTAMLPLYLRAHYRWDSLFARTRTLLTIHNLGYQGIFPAREVEALGLSQARGQLHQEELGRGRINFMTTGLLHADGLSTVSPTHAREIRTPEFGFGLDPLLRARSGDLVGILNGVDYGEWNPATDRFLPHSYSAADLEGKAWNKRALCEEAGLSTDAELPLIGIVSRLTAQKGFDLCFEALPSVLGRRPCQVVVLGSGERRYEEFFHSLARHFPGRVHFRNGFDNPLAHRIYAGADLFLVPSRFEPCGLTQMYSLRYGTVPVVRKTGGLADSVELYDRSRNTGTGFVFDSFDAEGLRWAIDYALDSWADPAGWRELVARGMAQDFSWERQGPLYLDLYSRLR